MCWMTETLTGAAIAAGGVKQPIDAFRVLVGDFWGE